MKNLFSITAAVALLLIVACNSTKEESGIEVVRSQNFESQIKSKLDEINARNIREEGFDGTGVTLGFSEDDGVDYSHADLEGVLDAASQEYVFGHEFSSGHGTSAAGIIAAQPNGFGVVGIAPGAKLLSVTQQYWEEKQANLEITISEGFMMNFKYLLENNVTIIHEYSRYSINAEGEGSLTQEYLSDMELLIENDVVIFFPAGNDGIEISERMFENDELFDRYGRMFVYVGAWEEARGDIAPYSNRAGIVKQQYILAPTDFKSTMVKNQFRDFNGTSASSPAAVAAFALLKQKYPSFSNYEILDAVYRTADDLGEPGVDDVYGRGRMNVQKASDFLEGVQQTSN